MAYRKPPSDTSKKEQPDEDRWESDSETVERYDHTVTDEDDAGGITNRPLDEEIANQGSLPERGDSREGAHAGRGHRKEER